MNYRKKVQKEIKGTTVNIYRHNPKMSPDYTDKNK